MVRIIKQYTVGGIVLLCSSKMSIIDYYIVAPLAGFSVLLPVWHELVSALSRMRLLSV